MDHTLRAKKAEEARGTPAHDLQVPFCNVLTGRSIQGERANKALDLAVNTLAGISALALRWFGRANF
jgi:hypothetical protein